MRVSLFGEAFGWEGGCFGGGGGRARDGEVVFATRAGDLAGAEADGGEDGDALAEGVVAAVEGAGEVLAHFQRGGDQQGQHALEAQLREVRGFPLVLQAKDGGGKIFDVV